MGKETVWQKITTRLIEIYMLSKGTSYYKNGSMPKWNLIETAEHGIIVLLSDGSLLGIGYREYYYNKSGQRMVNWNIINVWGLSREAEDAFEGEFTPTLWMPLPEPPK